MKSEKLIGIFGLVGLIGLLACLPSATNSRVYGSGGRSSGSGYSSHMTKFYSRHQASSGCDNPADKVAILACCVNGVDNGNRSPMPAFLKSIERALQSREPYTIDLFWNALECLGDALEMILSGDFRFPPACCKIEIFNQIKALCPYKKQTVSSRSRFNDDYQD